MEILSKKTLQDLTSADSETCISLYMPTHQTYPENLQDPIEYKHLLKQLEGLLLQKYTLKEAASYLKPFESLIDDKDFWNHSSPSIAIFSASGIFKIIGLQMNFEKLVIVAENFHTKPLRQYLQTMDRYQILGLSLDRIQLFEGNRYSLVEIKLPDEMPKTLSAALGNQLTEKYSTAGAYGGVHEGGEGMHHGDGGIKDQIDVDTEKFYRLIDKEVFENYSKPSGLPLILAALPEHHSLFHDLSKNPFLLKEGILYNPAYLSSKVLSEMAWEQMESVYQLKIKKLKAQYAQAKANTLASDDLEIISAAVPLGRIATLLIEAGTKMQGKIINRDNGEIESGSIDKTNTDDILDEISIMSTKMGAKVFVIQTSEMPSQTGIAAIFRF